MNYLVATTKSWNIEAFHHFSPGLPGDWHLITSPEALTQDLLQQLKPAYIFFPHWNWKVPADITSQYPCVCFHMTDLPFGRGGSPLQNLILRGVSATQLTALQMTDELDAGPIYAKLPLSLEGSAEQVFRRAAPIVYHLMEAIIQQAIAPVPQQGHAEYFQRRTAVQSELPLDADANSLYDFIRMLDAEGYPHAFIQHGQWRLEFSQANKEPNGEISAEVRFVPIIPAAGEPS
ncbi:MAG: methionyl-tRNA formyltransferase [Alkalimonas sp.]|nr:methionyl-tRNA formyltransferase [Alkalimonas sp.]